MQEDGSQILQALGVDLEELRNVVLERIDRCGGDPDGPDPDALATFGIDLAEVCNRARIQQPDQRVPQGTHARLTHEARAALQAAVSIAEDRHDRIISATHLLAGLAIGRSSRARGVLAQRGVTPTDVLALIQ